MASQMGHDFLAPSVTFCQLPGSGSTRFFGMPGENSLNRESRQGEQSEGRQTAPGLSMRRTRCQVREYRLLVRRIALQIGDSDGVLHCAKLEPWMVQAGSRDGARLLISAYNSI